MFGSKAATVPVTIASATSIIAVALAKANGHPDPEGYAARAVSELPANLADVQIAEREADVEPAGESPAEPTHDADAAAPAEQAPAPDVPAAPTPEHQEG